MKELLDAKAIDRVLTRIAHEIIENNKGVNNVVILGIKTRGVYIAQRIIEKIKKFEGVDVPFGMIDITFYRDDLEAISKNPIINSQPEIDVKDKTVILVDDVIYTGRTCRAALDAVFTVGRASKIQFVALIDRGHRELPVAPNYVGKNIPTSKNEIVTVLMKELDQHDKVILEERN